MLNPDITSRQALLLPNVLKSVLGHSALAFGRCTAGLVAAEMELVGMVSGCTTEMIAAPTRCKADYPMSKNTTKGAAVAAEN